MIVGNIPALAPVNFFAIQWDCRSLKQKETVASMKPRQLTDYLLPDTSSYCNEKRFAEVAMAWTRFKIELVIEVKSPYHRISTFSPLSGDNVELFFDTRDIKTSGYNTRFCHHFVFLPEKVDGVQAKEVTHFRTEDTHPLCDPRDLEVSSQIEEEGYRMNIAIPSSVLHGYDPEQVNHIGFTYRINRMGGVPQHFSMISEEYAIEQQPSLWSSAHLII